MQQFEELKNYLQANFVELDNAIRALLLGLTAKAHVFLLGPPGTAKSHLAEVVCDSLDFKAFRFLFTDETKHKDIFGIQSIQALKEDRDVLITQGKLPEAEVAYLDEIWKANASVVNMLLWALRDGKFTNGGQAVKMPLVFAIACSNEIPEDSTRRAIYDRLLIREEVKDIEMAENFRRVLERNDSSSKGSDERNRGALEIRRRSESHRPCEGSFDGTERENPRGRGEKLEPKMVRIGQGSQSLSSSEWQVRDRTSRP